MARMFIVGVPMITGASGAPEAPGVFNWACRSGAAPFDYTVREAAGGERLDSGAIRTHRGTP
jgi:hypothetical protein